MTILIDMDGVVVDFVGGVLAGLQKHGVRIRRENINHFTYLDWASEHADWAKEIAQADGFFLRLDPLPGAIDGVNELRSKHDIRFCSAPLPGNKTCETDKRAWIEKYFDKQLADEAFIGSDKTMCDGDYLIDDNPEVAGSKEPSWQHIVFDQSWNYASSAPRLFGLSVAEFDDLVR
ncbi:MAG: hypothetical protein AAF413_03645 [Patescibacteria group bacterium]